LLSSSILPCHPSSTLFPYTTLFRSLHMVEAVLRRSDMPLSLNRIKGLLPRKVMHRTLRDAIEHYKRLGCVTEGSKGVLWTMNTEDRKSTRLNSSHEWISYAVFCLKK